MLLEKNHNTKQNSTDSYTFSSPRESEQCTHQSAVMKSVAQILPLHSYITSNSQITTSLSAILNIFSTLIRSRHIHQVSSRRGTSSCSARHALYDEVLFKWIQSVSNLRWKTLKTQVFPLSFAAYHLICVLSELDHTVPVLPCLFVLIKVRDFAELLKDPQPRMHLFFAPRVDHHHCTIRHVSLPGHLAKQ